MRAPRRALAVVFVLIGSLLAVTVTGSTPAGAATALPNGFGAIAVDATHSHVFISSPSAGVVTVLDLSGAVVTTIAGEPGANSLLVDGDVLYVATTAGVVDAISTVTLTRTTSYGAGTLNAPTALAKAGGRIWTATSTCAGGGARLASINPSTGVVTVHAYISSLSYCPLLVSSPADPNVLLGFSEGTSPTTVVKLDVSSGAPVVVLERFITELSNTRQVAIAPDGNTFVVAAGGRYQIDQYRMSDLQPEGTVYTTGAYPNAVVSTPANGGLVAAGRDAPYDPDVDVYQLGNPAAHLVQTDLASTGTLLRRGLAFAPDGTTLFAVTSGNGSVWLNVVPVGSTPIPGDPTKSFGGIAVDGLRKRVYVSAPGANAIRVFDLAGNPLTTIQGEPGAASLLVDGGTLYVAATTAGTINAIDTATLVRTRTLAYGSAVQPGSLAKAGGKIWTTNGPCGSSALRLTSIDPVTGAVTAHPGIVPMRYCVILTSTPAFPNLLFAFNPGISPATVTKIDVSSGAPVVVAEQVETDLGNLKQLAFSPDGSTFYAASASPYEIDEFRTSDLLPTGVVYPSGYYPNAVATTAGAGMLLAAGRSSYTTPAATVMRLGHPGTEVLQTNLTMDEELLDGGLAFAPDGSRLYSVAQDRFTGVVTLRAQSIAVPTSVWFGSWVNPTVVGQGAAFTAAVELTGGGRATGGTVYFKEGSTLLGAALVRPDGTATIVTSTLAPGAHTIRASFIGPGYAASTSATLVQTVNKAATTSALATSANPAFVKTVVTFNATFAATKPGAGTPTGSALFYDGPTLIAVRTLSAGKATFATGSLAVGTHAITVKYNGDANFLTSTSPAVTQVIQPR